MMRYEAGAYRTGQVIMEPDPDAAGHRTMDTVTPRGICTVTAPVALAPRAMLIWRFLKPAYPAIELSPGL